MNSNAKTECAQLKCKLVDISISLKQAVAITEEGIKTLEQMEWFHSQVRRAEAARDRGEGDAWLKFAEKELEFAPIFEETLVADMQQQIKTVSEQFDMIHSEHTRPLKRNRVEKKEPVLNHMTGEMMKPEDCTCNFSGSCLAYCNPYK